MPESHSIHRLAKQFNDVFVGQELAVSSPQGRFTDGAHLLDGRRLVSAFAHGKHLFLGFDHELYLNVHLGIYGAWSFGGDKEFTGASSIGAPRKVGEREYSDSGDAGEYTGAPEPKPTVRVRLVSEHGWADLIGPTVCKVLTEPEMHAARAKLGPDPLNEDAEEGRFFRALERTARPIGAVLMDQKVISGIGNIFRAESLYRQRIDPYRPANTLTEKEKQELWQDNKVLLRRGVKLGRIVTTEPEDRPGIAAKDAWPTHANYVYHRQGESCGRCGTAIQVQELVGRKLYWCPGCQK